jgi:Chaperone of endosialidase
MKTITNIIYPTFALFAFACFALLPTPNAFGVVPAPDGGYPGFNTAEGQNALLHLTTGTANTAVGWLSLENVATGSFNTGVGAGTLVLNSGDKNTATGAAALLLNTTGVSNTANGALALLNNTEGSGNTAIGLSALSSNTDGNVNTAIGAGALFNSTGNGNTAIGTDALVNATGGFNTAFGRFAGENVTTADNVICIGADVAGQNVSNTCYIGNIFGVTSTGAAAVYVNSDGKLGTVVSSRRFKDEIEPMDKASEAILALKPVTFRYKHEIDPTRSPQFGLVAEQVEKVNPDLVVRDAEGKVNTVRYEAVNAMLLNEFLKAHRRIEEQDKRIDQLTAQLKEQKVLIQKVNDKVELNRPAPQTVANGQ